MMNEAVEFRPMESGDEAETRALVIRVFKEQVAPGYGPEGVDEFLAYMRPGALVDRLQKNQVALLATVRGRVVGVIEVRDYRHLSLLFVNRPFQRQGIARELLRRALDLARRPRPDLEAVSVHAAPDSVPIYARLGFRSIGGEQTVKGIRYTRMVLPLRLASSPGDVGPADRPDSGNIG